VLAIVTVGEVIEVGVKVNGVIRSSGVAGRTEPKFRFTFTRPAKPSKRGQELAECAATPRMEIRWDLRDGHIDKRARG
jgi:hypothetical protein